MSRFAIIHLLTDRLGLSNTEAQAVLEIVLDGMESILLDRGRVTFVGLGGLALKERRGRRQSGENTVRVQTEVVFTASQRLQERVDKQSPPRREAVKMRKKRKRRSTQRKAGQ